MSNTVVVIVYDEDGDPARIKQMTKETFRQALREEYWGQHPRFAKADSDVTESFVGLVVIDGEIVVPKVVQVATDYEV